MLGSDVLMRETLRLFCRISEHPLAFVAQRQVHGSGYLLANRGVSLDLLANGFDRGMGTQKAIGQGFIFAQKSQQKMFRLNIWRPELAGFVAREKDDAPRLLRIAFKHMALSPELSGRRRGQPGGPAPRNSLTLTPSCNQSANTPLFVYRGLGMQRLVTKDTLLVVSRQAVATSRMPPL